MNPQAASIVALIFTLALAAYAEAYYLSSRPFHGYHRPIPYVPTPALSVPHRVYCETWTATPAQYRDCMKKPMPR